jgi:hypothetical protein
MEKFTVATKSPPCMVNHAKRHRLPVESFSCETNDLEKYYCKECQFETDLMVIFNQHIREHRRRNIDRVQDQPKSNVEIKSYICQKCSLETYSILLWIKHLDSSCFVNKVSNVSRLYKRKLFDDIICFKCDHCSFKTEVLQYLDKHVERLHTHLMVRWFQCEACDFKTKYRGSLKIHVNTRHKSDEEANWFYCFNCEYKTRRKKNSKTTHVI